MISRKFKSSHRLKLDFLVNRSFLKTPITILQNIFIDFNEIRLNIKTSPVPLNAGLLDLQKFCRTKFDDSNEYGSPSYINLWRIARKVAKWTSSNETFYDIGCGKGRVLCVMARLPLRRVVGIEVDSALCKTAKTNAASLRERITPIDIRCEDAAGSNLSDGNIFFFYNPFGPDTLKVVINNILRTVLDNPRPLLLIYYNAVHEYLFAEQPSFRLFDSFATFTGRKVVFWEYKTLRPTSSI